ncbi:Short-chain dehydrogenase (YqjQ) [Commensalibacter communis]|uniref:SDR family NAD(P)-dependent oxidoreductase n=1 Tax=Commensalibacter communis TaxID=2972786 RepID=UPI0022FFBA55|nr:SDR family NAD(P)-dependent oxidoreductase [Commensalibacter communis]CAI3934463.1 Short-chain dehydrogenase (YqjQ) [Commensalibacter communis]CAI3940411.1 Short-chain dehydrogenase (YqjQ) [Commensalibacter communis]CAI3943745.1 Short-chain dehydrogenase (YqjQ) [Commensalibacter communis]
MPQSSDSILITGATSGIGQALALFYAKPGTKLFLWGRSDTKLQETAQRCKDKGAIVLTYPIDLTNPVSAVTMLHEIIQKFTINMAILAAGSGDIKAEQDILESQKTLYDLAQLNYVTPSLMGNLLAQHMIQKDIKGKIIFISSVAGFHSLPFATAYSSSKAGLTRFSDSLRLAVKKWKIQVTLVVPGFIDTPMSQRLECDKPFLMPLDKAVQHITEAISEGKKELILPKIFKLLKWIDLIAPSFLRDFILSRIKVKQD